MGVIKKFNPETGQWEIYGSTDAKDINLIDVSDNFEDKNVEGAFREVSNKIDTAYAELNAQRGTMVTHSSELQTQRASLVSHATTLNSHSSELKSIQNKLEAHAEDIAFLKEFGGGGGSGAAAPTITSTFEDCSVDKEAEVKIPIYFSSPNLGEGTAYVIVNNIEIGSFPGIKMGNNTINIGKVTEAVNEVSIYVKDRTGMLSNQLTWIIKSGGIELTVDFDDTADYFITDLIIMQYYVATASDDALKMHMTIDYDDYEIDCKKGFNEYEYPQLGIGIHKISFYVTDGTYSSPVKNYNVVIVNSNSLYVSSTFKNDQEFPMGTPVAIQYRVSKASNESFDVKLYLNNRLEKNLKCTPGAYYWTLNDLGIDTYTARIEVSGAYDETQVVEVTFEVIASDYNPIRITEEGLIYRLSAKGRTNQDEDREFPVDDSGNNVVTRLHNFNYFSNGWINGELLCDGEAYVEIDLYPYKDNALYGSTIEVQYCALDIGFSDSRIFDYTGTETPFKGAYIDIEQIRMDSLTNNIKLAADKDRYITVTYVIDRRNKFAKIFVDGICSTAFYLSDTGSGTSARREDFTHDQKIYLNSKKGISNFGACKIKDVRVYNRVLSDDEIVSNFIAQIEDLGEQEKLYNFNFDNKTLPVVRMYGDTSNMTLETPVPLRIKYTSPDEDKYGQSFDLPYCDVCWQGTSSLQYVLKNFTVRLKDENLAPFYYSPYPNGILEDTFCFKCDYMESTHSRNVGIAKFVNDCLYDSKNPMQQKDSSIRNTVNGFPVLMYINDELQGVYNFNLDRYSTKSFGYTDPDKCLVYEVSANSDTTAGAFFKWTAETGRPELDYYKSDFECLYPPTKAAGNDNMIELIRLIEWVNDSSDEDFRDNFERYFNKEYVLRYYLYVLIFGAVDSLGKNMKLASFDGGMTWYPQIYDADTSIGLDNTGYLKYDMDIEMGDKHVFNTTGSVLWKRVVELFQEELKEQYALMRLDRFTVDNIMSYVYGEQISKIPATFYNKDMQAKYLNFEDDFLIALHGSGEHHIRKWIRERIVYCDSLMSYMVEFEKDKFTVRASKQGDVYIDIQTYFPMYFTILWKNDESGYSKQTKRIGRGETVRFTYKMATATDQEIILYGGYYVKSLGDLSNLEPTYLVIKNASRLTEVICHSPNLVSTDIADCKLLQKIDLSNSSVYGIANATLNAANCKYLKSIDCRGTKLTAIYTMAAGGNLREIYYPESIQSITLTNQAYLEVAAIPYETNTMDQVTKYCENLADVEINNCRNIKHLKYPYNEDDELTLDAIKQVQNLKLITSLDKLDSLSFQGFYKLKNLTLSSMHFIKSLGFNNMLKLSDTGILEKITVSDCPLIENVSFNITDPSYKIEFAQGAVVDLGGVKSIKSIESNASIDGLETLYIPTTLKELKFNGTSACRVKNIWSASANHALDNFQGMDLLDVNLEYLDMNKLTNITNAINFHIAPKAQHPNMNTNRYSGFFKPEGSINLTDYTGSMVSMLKGVDLSKLDVIIDKPQDQVNLSGLFENAIIGADQIDKVNEILSKYDMSTIWSDMFKNATIGFDSNELIIPDASSYRDMNLSGLFYNTGVKTDIQVQSNYKDINNMFRKCRNVKTYLENWNSEGLHPELDATNCYFETGGDLELVPSKWGGYGFYPDVTSIIIVEIPSNNYEFKLAVKAKVTTEYGIVNWGDGTVNSLYDNDYSHTFARAGTYTIKGHFTLGEGQMATTSVYSTLKEVVQIAGKTTNLSRAFAYCSKLTKVNLGQRKVTDLSETFQECPKLTTILMSEIDTSEVTDMSSMFNNCQELTTLNLSHFNTDQVVNMASMFSNCQKLTSLNISSFNTENVTNMSRMFNYCRVLPQIDLSRFDTSKVTDMSYMFYNCSNIKTINLDAFGTAQVINMAQMFRNCTSLETLDLSKFNTEKVKSMKEMFRGCNKLYSLNIDSFNTGSVTDFSGMFESCSLLESMNTNFDTEAAIDMNSMFKDCGSLLTLDVTSFKTNNVTDMSNMFAGCGTLTELNVSNFNTENVTNMSAMFNNCSNILVIDANNFITDNVTNMSAMFKGCQNTTEIKISNFNTLKVKSMDEMFNNCRKVKSLDVARFTVDNVSNMTYIFGNCSLLESLDVSMWNVANVTNMSFMFTGCTSLTTLDINDWNIGKVTTTASMFYNCTKLTTLDLSKWILAACTTMNNMFQGCSSLTALDMSEFNTANCTDMSYMFYGCSKIKTLNVNHFNTAKVTNMRNMFYECKSLTRLELSNFNTDKVSNMAYMFSGLVCDIVFTNKTNASLTTTQAMFYIYYGTSINLENFSLAKSTNNTNFIITATNLMNFVAPSNIKSSIKIVADKLTYTSLMSIINNLSDVTTPMVLEIGAKNIAKLSDEDIAIAIGKGWSVC